jgi:competence protein ComEC
MRGPAVRFGRRSAVGHRWHVVAGFALLLACVPARSAPNKDHDDTLRVVFVDVEGGAATLFVTPQGHALLIDTGWPAGLPSTKPDTATRPAAPTLTSAQRVVAAARAAGLTAIDHVLITHYHVDHVGGLAELLAAFPVGEVIDHGPDRELMPANTPPDRQRFQPAELYPVYLKAIASVPHRVMTPGESFAIDALRVTVIDSDGAVLPAPLPEGGGPGEGCVPGAMPADIGTDENARSLGTVLRWGQARVLMLGDTTRDVEERLACPRDLIGHVDLMLADNHGTANAGSALLLDTVRPRVYVFNNGATKGADASSLQFVRSALWLQAAWQLHFATRSPADNAPVHHIANLAGADAMLPLRVDVHRDGVIDVTNPRTEAVETYAPSHTR